MNYLVSILFALFCLTGTAVAQDAPGVITLNLPASVLAETIQQSLPYELNQPSEALSGTITLERIDNLTLTAQGFSAHLAILGQNVMIHTELAGQQFRLNVGTVHLESALTARIRYEKSSRTLFITPEVTEIDDNTDPKNTEVGNLLVSLFNGRELPIAISELQPIITDAGNKKLAIDMQLDNVVVTPAALVLHLIPRTRIIKESGGITTSTLVR